MLKNKNTIKTTVAVDLIVQHILNGDNLAKVSTNGINGNHTIKPLFVKKQVSVWNYLSVYINL